MNTTNAVSLLVAGVLAGAVTCVSAQEIHKEVDDDGRITYTDVPRARPAALPRRGAKVEANEAARRLTRALHERDLGAEPHPGELSKGKGAATPNYRYWRRQERNRLVVELAQRRARETLRPQVVARANVGDS